MLHVSHEEEAHSVEVEDEEYFYDPGYWRHTNDDRLVNALHLIVVVVFEEHENEHANVRQQYREDDDVDARDAN